MASEKRVRARVSLLHVDLKDMREPWNIWCALNGLTASEGARRVVRGALENNPASLDGLPHLADVGRRSDANRRRVEIRLTNAEHLALEAVAAGEGMGVSRWLTAVMRLHLTGDQQFGDQELRALTRSSQVLMALARNINQVARNMHARADRDDLAIAQINYLVGLIKTHTEAVSAVLTANSRRWRR